MNRYTVFDGRGNYEINKASVLDTFLAKTNKKAIKIFKVDFKDIDCVLCDGQSNVIWSTQWED